MTDTHFNEPIDKSKPLSGTGRRGFEVPPEVQQKVIDIIIEEARKMGFNNRDLAYYIAIAKRESSFNPDAANPNGTASGIAQVIDKTAATYGVNDSNRFDARSSIKAGLGYFRDLKAETIKDYGSAAGKFEPLIYYRYHYGEFSTRNREMVPVGNGKRKKETWHPKEFSELEKTNAIPTPRPWWMKRIASKPSSTPARAGGAAERHHGQADEQPQGHRRDQDAQAGRPCQAASGGRPCNAARQARRASACTGAIRRANVGTPQVAPSAEPTPTASADSSAEVVAEVHPPCRPGHRMGSQRQRSDHRCRWQSPRNQLRVAGAGGDPDPAHRRRSLQRRRQQGRHA
jgi:hypothetical protein